MADVGNYWAQGFVEIPVFGLPTIIVGSRIRLGAIVEMKKENAFDKSSITKITLYLAGQPVAIKLAQLGDGVFTGYKTGSNPSTKLDNPFLSFEVNFQLIVSIEGYDVINMVQDTIKGRAFLSNHKVIMDPLPDFIDQMKKEIRQTEKRISSFEDRILGRLQKYLGG